MQDRINKKEIRELAIQEIRKGRSKQEVYEELVEKYEYRNDIANIIKNIATNKRLKKYDFLNSIYLVFLIILTITLLLYSRQLGLLWMVWLIYIVATKKFQYYYWNSLWGVVMLISSFAMVVYFRTMPWEILYFLIPISLILTLTGIYLPRLLVPAYEEVREPYTGSDGRTRMMIKHVFKE